MKNETLPHASPALRLIDFWYSPRMAIPAPLIERAKLCLLDALGCGLFGSRQAWGEIMMDEVRADGSSGECTLLGSSTTIAAPQAALCNGTAIHGFELD